MSNTDKKKEHIVRPIASHPIQNLKILAKTTRFN